MVNSILNGGYGYHSDIASRDANGNDKIDTLADLYRIKDEKPWNGKKGDLARRFLVEVKTLDGIRQRDDLLAKWAELDKPNRSPEEITQQQGIAELLCEVLDDPKTPPKVKESILTVLENRLGISEDKLEAKLKALKAQLIPGKKITHSPANGPSYDEQLTYTLENGEYKYRILRSPQGKNEWQEFKPADQSATADTIPTQDMPTRGLPPVEASYNDNGIAAQEYIRNQNSDPSVQREVDHSKLEPAKEKADKSSADLAVSVSGDNVTAAIIDNEEFIKVLEAYQPSLVDEAGAVAVQDYVRQLGLLKEVLTAREDLINALKGSDPNPENINELYGNYIAAMAAYDPENSEIQTLTLETLITKNTAKGETERELGEFRRLQGQVMTAIGNFQKVPNEENYDKARTAYTDFYNHCTDDFKASYGLSSIPEIDTIFSSVTEENREYTTEETRRTDLEKTFEEKKSALETEINYFNARFPIGASNDEIERALRPLYTDYVTAARAINSNIAVQSFDDLFKSAPKDVYTLRINEQVITDIPEETMKEIGAQIDIINSTVLKYESYTHVFDGSINAQLTAVKNAAIGIQAAIRSIPGHDNFIMYVNPTAFVNVSTSAGAAGNIVAYNEDKKNAALFAYIIKQEGLEESSLTTWEERFSAFTTHLKSPDFSKKYPDWNKYLEEYKKDENLDQNSKIWDAYLAYYKGKNPDWESNIDVESSDINKILYAYQIKHPAWGGEIRATTLGKAMREAGINVGSDNLTIFAVRGNKDSTSPIVDAGGNVGIHGEPLRIERTDGNGDVIVTNVKCPGGPGGGFALPVSSRKEERFTINTPTIIAPAFPTRNPFPPEITTYECKGFTELTLTPESMPEYIGHSEAVPEAPAAPPDPGRNIPPYAPVLNETYTIEVGENPGEVERRYLLDIRDSSGDTHTLTLGDLPEGLTEENVRFTFEPDEDEDGKGTWYLHASGLQPREDTDNTYTFEYTVKDQKGASGTGTISIKVTQDKPEEPKKLGDIAQFNPEKGEFFYPDGIGGSDPFPGSFMQRIFQGKQLSLEISGDNLTYGDNTGGNFGIGLAGTFLQEDNGKFWSFGLNPFIGLNNGEIRNFGGTFNINRGILGRTLHSLTGDFSYATQSYEDDTRGTVDQLNIGGSLAYQWILNFANGAQLSLAASVGLKYERQDWTIPTVIHTSTTKADKSETLLALEKPGDCFVINTDASGAVTSIGLKDNVKDQCGPESEVFLLVRVGGREFNLYNDAVDLSNYAGQPVEVIAQIQTPKKNSAPEAAPQEVPEGSRVVDTVIERVVEFKDNTGQTVPAKSSDTETERVVYTVGYTSNTPAPDQYSLDSSAVTISAPSNDGRVTISLANDNLDQFTVTLVITDRDGNESTLPLNTDNNYAYPFDPAATSKIEVFAKDKDYPDNRLVKIYDGDVTQEVQQAASSLQVAQNSVQVNGRIVSGNLTLTGDMDLARFGTLSAVASNGTEEITLNSNSFSINNNQFSATLPAGKNILIIKDKDGKILFKYEITKESASVEATGQIDNDSSSLTGQVSGDTSRFTYKAKIGTQTKDVTLDSLGNFSISLDDASYDGKTLILYACEGANEKPILTCPKLVVEDNGKPAIEILPASVPQPTLNGNTITIPVFSGEALAAIEALRIRGANVKLKIGGTVVEGYQPGQQYEINCRDPKYTSALPADGNLNIQLVVEEGAQTSELMSQTVNIARNDDTLEIDGENFSLQEVGGNSPIVILSIPKSIIDECMNVPGKTYDFTYIVNDQKNVISISKSTILTSYFDSPSTAKNYYNLPIDLSQYIGVNDPAGTSDYDFEITVKSSSNETYNPTIFKTKIKYNNDINFPRIGRGAQPISTPENPNSFEETTTTYTPTIPSSATTNPYNKEAEPNWQIGSSTIDSSPASINTAGSVINNNQVSQSATYDYVISAGNATISLVQASTEYSAKTTCQTAFAEATVVAKDTVQSDTYEKFDDKHRNETYDIMAGIEAGYFHPIQLGNTNFYAIVDIRAGVQLHKVINIESSTLGETHRDESDPELSAKLKALPGLGYSNEDIGLDVQLRGIVKAYIDKNDARLAEYGTAVNITKIINDNLAINAQGTAGWNNEGSLENIDLALALRLKLNEKSTLSLSASGSYNHSNNSLIIRPGVEFNFADRWGVKLSAEIPIDYPQNTFLSLMLRYSLW
jgi:hypothetical protein